MKAMVLVAGMGTRLGGLTRDTPKPMLDAGGRPILDLILLHLAAGGFTDVVLNLHFHPEAIRDHVGDGARFGLRVAWSPEPALLGTAGALRRAAALLRGGPFLVQYGDVVTDMDLGALLRSHDPAALATLVLHRRPGSNSAVRLEADGRIAEFLERPTEEERRRIDEPWVNSGVCACSPEILDLIPAGPADLPRDVFVPLAPRGLLRGVPLRGYRCAVDSPARLEELRAAIGAGRCRIREGWPAAGHAVHREAMGRSG